MPKKPKHGRKRVTSSEYLLPQPSAEGIAELRALHLGRTGEEITEDEAKDALGRIMRFQYLNFMINTDGLPPGGPVPLGYRLTEDGRWDEDQVDGPLVRRAFKMRKKGATIREVCAEGAAAGLRSRRGNEIGPSSMLKILGNPVYGDLVRAAHPE